MKFALVDAEKAQHSITSLCSLLDVSRAGFYAWRIRPESSHAVEDRRLRVLVRESHERSRQRYAALVARILKSGVKFAAGSDMCWFYPGKTRGEATASVFPSLRDAGMPPLDIIRAITTNAAELLGWQDRVGAIEPGKFADIIAIDGDPIQNINAIEKVVFVMKDGMTFKNDLAPKPALGMEKK